MGFGRLNEAEDFVQEETGVADRDSSKRNCSSLADLIRSVMELRRYCLDDIGYLGKVLEYSNFSQSESGSHFIFFTHVSVLNSLVEFAYVFTHYIEVRHNHNCCDSCRSTST